MNRYYLPKPFQHQYITARERDVLLLCRDYTNQDIAAMLGISQRTVDLHVRVLRDKLACKTKQALGRFVAQPVLPPDLNDKQVAINALFSGKIADIPTFVRQEYELVKKQVQLQNNKSAMQRLKYLLMKVRLSIWYQRVTQYLLDSDAHQIEITAVSHLHYARLILLLRELQNQQQYYACSLNSEKMAKIKRVLAIMQQHVLKELIIYFRYINECNELGRDDRLQHALNQTPEIIPLNIEQPKCQRHDSIKNWFKHTELFISEMVPQLSKQAQMSLTTIPWLADCVYFPKKIGQQILSNLSHIGFDSREFSRPWLMAVFRRGARIRYQLATHWQVNLQLYALDKLACKESNNCINKKLLTQADQLLSYLLGTLLVIQTILWQGIHSRTLRLVNCLIADYQAKIKNYLITCLKLVIKSPGIYRHRLGSIVERYLQTFTDDQEIQTIYQQYLTCNEQWKTLLHLKQVLEMPVVLSGDKLKDIMQFIRAMNPKQSLSHNIDLLWKWLANYSEQSADIVNKLKQCMINRYAQYSQLSKEMRQFWLLLHRGYISYFNEVLVKNFDYDRFVELTNAKILVCDYLDVNQQEDKSPSSANKKISEIYLAFYLCQQHIPQQLQCWIQQYLQNSTNHSDKKRDVIDLFHQPEDKHEQKQMSQCVVSCSSLWKHAVWRQDIYQAMLQLEENQAKHYLLQGLCQFLLNDPSSESDWHYAKQHFLVCLQTNELWLRLINAYGVDGVEQIEQALFNYCAKLNNKKTFFYKALKKLLCEIVENRSVISCLKFSRLEQLFKLDDFSVVVVNLLTRDRLQPILDGYLENKLLEIKQDNLCQQCISQITQCSINHIKQRLIAGNVKGSTIQFNALIAFRQLLNSMRISECVDQKLLVVIKCLGLLKHNRLLELLTPLDWQAIAKWPEDNWFEHLAVLLGKVVIYRHCLAAMQDNDNGIIEEPGYIKEDCKSSIPILRDYALIISQQCNNRHNGLQTSAVF